LSQDSRYPEVFADDVNAFLETEAAADRTTPPKAAALPTA
jgi:hypothetical protein